MKKTQFIPAELPVFLDKHISIQSKSKKENFEAKVFFFGSRNFEKLAKLAHQHAYGWQQQKLDPKKDSFYFETDKGKFWFVHARQQSERVSHDGSLEESAYTWARETAGQMLQALKAQSVATVEFIVSDFSSEQWLGFFVGLEMAAYNFKNVIEAKAFEGFPKISFAKSNAQIEKSLKEARSIGVATNWARHLVNLPPNILNPVSYADCVAKLFKARKNVRVEIWDEKRLAKENMGLHLGVGIGSKDAPRLVRICYRPKTAKTKKPIAIVGKGVTFDSGGLDIKPSSGMRLMKKDMGGSASSVGIALWASLSNYSRPLDIYLALAENSIDGKSFRPSDVLTARNGLKVEIHNTDAEGRLVLGDALDVAVTQKAKDEPEMVINLATLTGAIKVGLGAEIAGLFSNHDPLAEKLQKAGTQRGELSWRMPLYSKYTQGMNSSFADIVNALDGFGGAITAALFLEKFIKQKPWAHLDIYSWADRPTGSLGFAGGNGQCVQMFSAFLESVE